jgi:Na+-translocating ferredoxin:NAD+ oxidoreductase subunit A
MSYLSIIITYSLINNFVLVQFLGLCPFIGISRRTEPALGLSLAVVFVSSIAGLVTWAVQHGILLPLGIGYLQTVTFILVIAGLVQFLEILIRRISPALYKALGIYLPLITTNCVVLGVALIAVRSNYNALESFTAGAAAGGGFMLAMVLMANIREQLDKLWIPRPFRGAPIAFITAGIMALAFMAFDRALLKNLAG